MLIKMSRVLIWLNRQPWWKNGFYCRMAGQTDSSLNWPTDQTRRKLRVSFRSESLAHIRLRGNPLTRFPCKGRGALQCFFLSQSRSSDDIFVYSDDSSGITKKRREIPPPRFLATTRLFLSLFSASRNGREPHAEARVVAVFAQARARVSEARERGTLFGFHWAFNER